MPRPKTPAEEVASAPDSAAKAPAASGQPSFLTPPDPIPDSDIVETVECDIVICGAGICGLPRGHAGAENGANVHVVEKGSTYGLFRLCTAGFNSDVQAKLGLTTDRKEFVTSTWAITNGVQGRMSSYGLWFDNSGPYINCSRRYSTKKGLPADSGRFARLQDHERRRGHAGRKPPVAGFRSDDLLRAGRRSFFATGNPVDWTGVMEPMPPRRRHVPLQFSCGAARARRERPMHGGHRQERVRRVRAVQRCEGRAADHGRHGCRSRDDGALQRIAQQDRPLQHQYERHGRRPEDGHLDRRRHGRVRLRRVCGRSRPS